VDNTALDVLVQLRMHIGGKPRLGHKHLRGNLMAEVALGAAVAFIEGQPPDERWRFTLDLGRRTLKACDIEEIWRSEAFWAWARCHD